MMLYLILPSKICQDDPKHGLKNVHIHARAGRTTILNRQFPERVETVQPPTFYGSSKLMNTFKIGLL